MSKSYETKNLYLAIDIEYHGMAYAYVEKIPDNENLVCVFESLIDEHKRHGETVRSMNVWPKHIAESSTEAWNDVYKKENRYFWKHFKDYDRTTGKPILDIEVND